MSIARHLVLLFAVGATTGAVIGCHHGAHPQPRPKAGVGSHQSHQGTGNEPPEPTRYALQCPQGMALIPAGELIGKPKHSVEAAGTGEVSWVPEERATVSAFCLDYVEVDVAHFGSRAGSGECTPESKRLPVEVSYAAAVAHCASRNKRIPTAREWKYAAGGQFNWTCPWGDCWDGKILADGVCWKRTESDGPCEVGTSPRDVSPQGVLDLAGNLSEWVHEDPTAFVRWPLANEDPPADPGAQISVLGIGGARYTVPARPLFFYFDPRFFEDDGRNRAAIRCAADPQMLPVAQPPYEREANELRQELVRVRDSRNFAVATEQTKVPGVVVQREGEPLPRVPYVRVVGYALGFDFHRDRSGLDSDVKCQGAVEADGTLCPSVVLPGVELTRDQVTRLLALRKLERAAARTTECLRSEKHAFVFYAAGDAPVAEVLVDLTCGWWSLSGGRTSPEQIESLMALCRELRLPACEARGSELRDLAEKSFDAAFMETDLLGRPRQKWLADAPLPEALLGRPLSGLSGADKRLVCAWNAQHAGRMFGYESKQFELRGAPPREARLQRWPECTASFPSCTSSVADVLSCMDVAQSGNPWFVAEAGASQERAALLQRCARLKQCTWGFTTVDHEGPPAPGKSSARAQ